MRFEQLYYFVKIADLHSFSAASSYLFVSQQALSTSIKNLEKKFQTQLFIRTPRGVVLSEEGQYFYEIARNMLSLYEELHYHFLIEPEHLKKEESLSIALNKSNKMFYFNKIISYFYKTFPSCHINYLIRKNDDIIDCILEKEADLGVLPVLSVDNQLQVEIPESLKFIPFHKSRFALLTNIDSPLAKFKSISMSTIIKHPLIMNDFSLNGDNLFKNILSCFSESPNIITADSYPLLTQLIEDNVGHTLTPEDYPSPSPQCVKIPISDNILFLVGFLYPNAPLTEFQKLYIDKSINLIEKDVLN